MATLSAGLLAFVGVMLGVAQKWRADRREHWWLRTQWALERLEHPPPARDIGIVVLGHQLKSHLATADDVRLLPDMGTFTMTGYGDADA